MEKTISKDFSTLKGRTLTSVEVDEEKTFIKFTTDNNLVFNMYHDQDCCEVVKIEDIAGDWADIIGLPILVAELVVSPHEKETVSNEIEDDDHYTWSYYKLATVKGWVVVRWYGSSNGYYSEEVSFGVLYDDQDDYGDYDGLFTFKPID